MAGTLDRGSVLADPSVKTVTAAYTSTTVGDQAAAVLAAVAGKKIRIFAIAVSISIGGTNCYLRNSGAGTQITETFLRTLSGSSFPAYYSRVGFPGIFLYESDVGKGIVLNCTTASANVSVSLVYSYV
jgi:hypothetical protein